jgi:hypothetical protein
MDLASFDLFSFPFVITAVIGFSYLIGSVISYCLFGYATIGLRAIIERF